MRVPSITIRRVPGRKSPWGAFWREPAKNGKEQKRRRFFATEREAEQFRTNAYAKVKSLPPASPSAVITNADTVAVYLGSWLATHVKPKREAKTHNCYESLVRIHINPAPLIGDTWTRLVPTAVGQTFGDLTMAQLRPLVVRRLYEDLFDRGVSLATRRHVHACLSSALGTATLDEVIDANPCLSLGRELRHKNEPTADPQPNPLTRPQAKAFLAYVKKHEREWFEYFQFLHDTGVRVGEAAALKWDHVDLDRKRAEVVASYSPAEGRDKDPKTHQKRWIDLTDLVVKQLTDLRKRQRVETLKAGRTPRQYVFTNRRGSPRRQDGNMRRVFDRVAKACELGDRTPHDLRDTFATTHLSDHYERLPWVSRQLGHETERTTTEHYFRFLPSKTSAKFANEIR